MLVRALGLSLLIVGVSIAAGQAADITYTYDALGRLTNVAYGCGASAGYVYDAAGNRTSTSSTGPCNGDNPPVAVNDSITTNVSTPITFDPRTNDSDPDNDPLTITATGPASHGTVVINSGTSLTYTPTTGYAGADSFTYTISDGRGGMATATVSATIGGPNQPPVARADTIAIQKSMATSYDPRINDNDPDNDPITITAVSTPSHGTATILSGTQIRYTPTSGYLGADSFTYTISDGQGHSVTATETINVQSTKNNSPNGTNDNVTVTSSPFTFDPRVNDSDPDGDTITIVSLSGTPSHGTAVIGPGGQSLIYTKNAGYTGTDHIVYRISDSAGNTSSNTTVNLTVQ